MGGWKAAAITGWLVALVLLAVLLMAARYGEGEVTFGTETRVVRIDRWTGEAEVLYLGRYDAFRQMDWRWEVVGKGRSQSTGAR